MKVDKWVCHNSEGLALYSLCEEVMGSVPRLLVFIPISFGWSLQS